LRIKPYSYQQVIKTLSKFGFQVVQEFQFKEFLDAL
jgi:hypothetical protein